MAASRQSDDAGSSLTSDQPHTRQLLGAGRHAATVTTSPFLLPSDLTDSTLLSEFSTAGLTADEAAGTVSRNIYTRTAGTVPSGSSQLQGAAAAFDTAGLTTAVTVDSSDVTSFTGSAGDSSPMPPDYRIVGGTAAPINRFKWICSMRTSKDFHFCGCSLIAPGVVLTAAHCLSSADPEFNLPWVEVGRYTLQGPNETFAGNDFDRFRCEKSVVYPGWNMEVGLNDIALCILPGASRYTPVKLAAESTPIAENSVVTVMGWGAQTESGGSSDTLLQVDVEVESLTSCNATYGNKIRSTQLCAGMPEGNADACQGDSGGPLFIEGSAAAGDLQIGIVSYGVGCGRPRIPGVYTDVRKYRRWIADRLLENGISYDPVTNLSSSSTASPLSSLSRPAASSLLSLKPVAASTSTVTGSNGGTAGGWQNLLGFLLG